MAEVQEPRAASGVPAFETVPEVFAQVAEWLRGGYVMLAIEAGYRSGALDALRSTGRGTAAEIATAGSLSERHVLEWLSLLATSGLVRYEPESKVFSAAPGLLAAPLPPNPPPFGLFARLMPDIVETMRSGGGLGYDRYDDLMCSGAGSAVADRFLLDAWVPSVDGLADRLTSGASVAEIGCGEGHATNLLARQFPASTFIGFDVSPQAVARAVAEREAWRLSNARFEVRDVTELPADGHYDVVLAIDCIHDQAHPGRVLAEARRCIADDGVLVMIEPRASSKLEENIGQPMSTAAYAMSLFHCMQVSLAGGGEGLGTAWGRERAVALLADSGFRTVAVLDAAGPIVPQSLFVCAPSHR